MRTTRHLSETNPQLNHALRVAIDHLRREHARPGSKEGGYVVDEGSSAVFEYVVGTENSIEFDEETLNRCASGCVLHSHPANSPAKMVHGAS